MNPWILFEKLISSKRRTIAKVSFVNPSTGKVQVLQVGDSVPVYVESNGATYANDSYVFIENGAITGQAPNVRTVVTELLS